MDAVLSLAWIPLVTALIGWGTNWLAIRMLFRPHQPHRICGVTFQGLLPRRKEEVADKVAEVVERELLNQHVIREELQRIDFQGYINTFVSQIIRGKVATRLRKIPLLGAVIDEGRIASLERTVLDSIQEDVEPMREKLAVDLEANLQVKDLVRSRIESFELEHLEKVVLDVAKRELRAIELLGFILGFVVGCVQVGILLALG